MTKKERGIFERVPGSNIWHIRWNDRDSRLRKELAGTRAAARKLYNVRKGEALKGIPHKFRTKRVTFEDLAKAALEHSKIHKKSYDDDVERMAVLVEWFGARPADSIRPQDIERKLSEAKTRKKNPKPLSPATQNRYKAMMSLTYTLAVTNGKVATNPVRQVKHRKENNTVTRVLKPAEEAKLKAAVKPPERWAIIQLAIHTGARAGELWNLKHAQVDRTDALVTLLNTKNGENKGSYR